MGAVTGSYTDASNLMHGFLRAPDGTFTTFDVPGAAFTDPLQCGYPCGPDINLAGAIAGDYQDTSFVFHGFLRAPDGTFTTFDAPGAGTGSNQGTFALSINRAGAITGYYTDASFVQHGFLRARDGTVTTFNAPGALYTVPLRINAKEKITGYYCDASACHGFVLTP